MISNDRGQRDSLSTVLNRELTGFRIIASSKLLPSGIEGSILCTSLNRKEFLGYFCIINTVNLSFDSKSKCVFDTVLGCTVIDGGRVGKNRSSINRKGEGSNRTASNSTSKESIPLSQKRRVFRCNLLDLPIINLLGIRRSFRITLEVRVLPSCKRISKSLGIPFVASAFGMNLVI